MIKLEDCCPASLVRGIREPHAWVTIDPYEPDWTRPIELDPMIGCLVYTDTDTPVYPYPYQPITGRVTSCRQCGRTHE